MVYNKEYITENDYDEFVSLMYVQNAVQSPNTNTSGWIPV